MQPVLYIWLDRSTTEMDRPSVKRGRQIWAVSFYPALKTSVRPPDTIKSRPVVFNRWAMAQWWALQLQVTLTEIETREL